MLHGRRLIHPVISCELYVTQQSHSVKSESNRYNHLLAWHSKGLIYLSACLRGDINETIGADRQDEAKSLAYEYQDMFGRATSSSKSRTTDSTSTNRSCPASSA